MDRERGRGSQSVSPHSASSQCVLRRLLSLSHSGKTETLLRVEAAISLLLMVMTPPPMLLCRIAESAILFYPFDGGGKGFKRQDG